MRLFCFCTCSVVWPLGGAAMAPRGSQVGGRGRKGGTSQTKPTPAAADSTKMQPLRFAKSPPSSSTAAPSEPSSDLSSAASVNTTVDVPAPSICPPRDSTDTGTTTPRADVSTAPSASSPPPPHQLPCQPIPSVPALNPCDAQLSLHWLMLARVLGKLARTKRHQIHKTLIALTRVGQSRGFRGVPIATGCSGTDSCVVNLNMLAAVFPGVVFDQRFQVEIDKDRSRKQMLLGCAAVLLLPMCCCSCDCACDYSCRSLCFSSCQEKQRWLKMFVPESAHLFADVGRLGMDRIVDWKTANGTGTLVDLMSVLFFVAGFSCKSVSALNPQRQQHSHCAIDHSGTTGTTLKGLQQQ